MFQRKSNTRAEATVRIGVLGTGMVGNTIASKLIERGHEVQMGARNRGNEKAEAWSRGAGERSSTGTFGDAAEFGEVLFNCTSGVGSLDALHAAGAERLGRKILIDLANPLDFSRGMPPSLSVSNTDSLGEQIQRAFPDLRVVKTLNTLNHLMMVNPQMVPGDHNIFVSGNDAEAKQQVVTWLGEWFGWRAEQIIDVGDITTARGTEMLLPLWIRLFMKFGTPAFNWHIAR
jgi:predicted dinucleotide-binding enzyme